MRAGTFPSFAVAACLACLAPLPALGVPCSAPDNGSGTVTLPPTGCRYVGQMQISEGLPMGTTIQISQAVLGSFSSVTEAPGGTLGGNLQQFDGTLQLSMTGTGLLSGFSRSISIDLSGPMANQTSTAPRTPGTSPQSFDLELFRLFGEIVGDPDFDLLRIVGGSDFGLTSFSMGSATLTDAGGGSWSVSSDLWVPYRIDYVGAPGSVLLGRSGSSPGTELFVLIPEPSSLDLLGLGLAPLLGLVWRQRERSA